MSPVCYFLRMTEQSPVRVGAVRTIILTGLLAGILDGVAAELLFFISGGRNPAIVFQYIASGVFGRTAFNGGTLMAVSGLLSHLVIAFSWTSLYFLAYPRLTILAKRKILAGVAYGLVIWLAMNMVVLPLSNARRGPFDPLRALTGIVVLMAAVGLPVSLSAHRYYSKQNRTT